MHNLPHHQGLRNHTDHLSASLQHGISHHTHQSDLCCAVDQAGSLFCQRNPKGLGGSRKAGLCPVREPQYTARRRIATSSNLQHSQWHPLRSETCPNASCVSA